MNKLTKELINSIDSQNMYQLLKDYWKHTSTAIESARKSTAKYSSKKNITEIVILGIGGSAISGELIKSYLAVAAPEKNIKVVIVRGNEVLHNITDETCIIASSYSGNTWETLDALDICMQKTKNIIGITSGGKLKKICDSNNFPVLDLPTGMMPRCAIMYSFFQLLYLFKREGILDTLAVEPAVEEILSRVDSEQFDYSNLAENNIAMHISNKLYNKLPIVYSSAYRTDAVNLRLRAQIQENADMFAFGGFIPEACHNEINGWTYPEDLVNRFVVIFIKDKEDHEEITKTMDVYINLLTDKRVEVIELEGSGENLLARLFDLICICDWISFFLAITNGTDPTPIPEIIKLKSIVGK